MKPTTNKLLTEAIQQFQHWRNTRPGRRGPTPRNLQKLAVELTKEIPTGQIVSSLKINHSMLRRWQQAHDNASPTTPEFVHLPLPNNTPHVTDAQQSVTFKYPNGVELAFSEVPPIEMMSALIHHPLPAAV